MITKHLKVNRRRIHYVDHHIQKWLLIALVVMECVLIALALWALYDALTGIVDENLYRIHFQEGERMFERFIGEAIAILLGIGVLNLLAIIIADRIWAAYVNGIVRRLDALVDDALHLNFTDDDMVCTHAVLEDAAAWRKAEGMRMRRMRECLAALPQALPGEEAERAQAGELLEQMKRIASGAAA